MAAAYDVYGAIANHVADNVPTFDGNVWVGDMPEHAVMPYAVVTDGGFASDWSFGDVNGDGAMTWVDTGTISVHVITSDCDETRRLAELVKRLFSKDDAGVNITTDGTFGIIEIMRKRFNFALEPEVDPTGARVYRYELNFQVRAQGRY